MSPRRLRAAATLALLGSVVLGLPATAAAGWTPVQQLGAPSPFEGDVVVASNARGDAVAVFVERKRISVARARAHGPFGRRVQLAGSGNTPKVAIDADGTALIGYTYFDNSRTAPSYTRDDGCCQGAKVAVWRRGHARPTSPRAVRPRGVITQLAAVAAAHGRRGVIYTEVRERGQVPDPTRFAPVGLDGRMGKVRAIPGQDAGAITLQFDGRRAVVGLLATSYPEFQTRLLSTRQSSSGAFAVPQVFARMPGVQGYELVVVPDGRGGQVAAWLGGSASAPRFMLGRKPASGAWRTQSVAAGPATGLHVGAPAVSPDGWIVAPFARVVRQVRDERVVVVARTPGGRLIRTALAGRFEVNTLAAAVTRGGAGAIGLRRSRNPSTRTDQLFVLRGGRPRRSGAYSRTSPAFITGGPVLTANPVDHARAVMPRRGQVVATRLR